MAIVPTTPLRLAYRVPEAADALGVCRAHVYNLIARGELRAVKIGSATRIPASELDRLIGGAEPATRRGDAA